MTLLLLRRLLVMVLLLTAVVMVVRPGHESLGCEVGVVPRGGVWAVSEDACLWKLDNKEEGGETGCCEECKYTRLGLCLLLLMRMPAAILALLGARLFVAVG
jgi:hypothetical protein